MDVVDADLPVVAAVLGSQRQHVAIGNDASEAGEALPVGWIEHPFGRDLSQQRCELLARVFDDRISPAVTKLHSPISTFTVEY